MEENVPLPRHVMLELTNVCDLACRHCSYHGENVHRNRPIGRMAEPVWRAALAEIGGWGVDVDVPGASAYTLTKNGYKGPVYATQATIDESGPAARGMYLSVAGVPIDAFKGAAAEYAQQLQEGPLAGKAIDPYAIYGAQSAQIVLDAIEASDGSRSDVIAKMFETQVEDGLLGDFGFNENGDPTNASGAVVGFTMYVATTELETADNFSPKPETVEAAGAA